jgi:uncharacterized protein (TIGR03435 family)
MTRFGFVLIVFAVVGVTVLSAHVPPGQSAPAFEVASVKTNTSGAAEGSLGPRPGGYGATNVPLRIVIVRAYQLRPFQVVGGPSWIDSERFDLDARASASQSHDEVLAMLQALLAERFKLVVRRETREQPVYALVTARHDGLFGPQLKRSTTECSSRTAADPTGPCRMGGSFTGRSGSLQGVGQPLTQLATHLGTAADRIVLDRTGLAGTFDFTLTWKSGGFGVSRVGAADDGPSLFTALQEQLGLELEPARGPVEVLVIDSVARPTPD